MEAAGTVMVRAGVIVRLSRLLMLNLRVV